MSLKGALEYAKLSISGFGAEVVLNEKLIDEIIAELNKVEEMQKAMQDIHDKLNYCSSHEFEETIQYCITKAFYALKGEPNEQ